MTKLLDVIEQKQEEARGTIRRAEMELELLRRQKLEATKTPGLKSWLGNDFESSSGLTPEFQAFAREYRAFITKGAGQGLELLNWNRGHFEVSGFLKNRATGKLVYFSTSDVRYFSDSWHDNILIRTAEHDRDYTGGSNCDTTLDRIFQDACRMTS